MTAATAADVAPPRISVERAGSGRSYAIDGVTVPSVTTLLNGGWPKPALVQWSADETARFAIEHLEDVTELGPVRAYEKFRKGRFQERDRVTVFGTQVHALAERLAHGEEVDVPPDAVGHVDQCIRFLEDYQVQIVAAERTVANGTVGYAGTFDLLADTRLGRVLIDYKTGRSGVWPEAALQLAAYRHAEWMLDSTGSQTLPMVPVDLCVAVWLQADSYQVIPLAADGWTFQCFRYVAEVAKLVTADRGTFVGSPL